MGIGMSSVGVAAVDPRARKRIEQVLRSAGETAVLPIDPDGPGMLDGPEFESVVFACSRIGNDELRSIDTLRQLAPSAGIVIVATTVENRSVRRAFDAGADGIVIEDQLDQSLIAALQAVRAGQLTVPRNLRSHWGKPALSTREKQILGMVVMGFTNTQIARSLFVTESTVKSHLSSVFAKLGVRSRNEATDLILDPENGFGTGVLAISDGAEDTSSR
jgi:DNA-binding NarL/FixJ family response regulator